MKFYKVVDAIEYIIEDGDFRSPKIVYYDAVSIYIDTPWDTSYYYAAHQFICAYRKLSIRNDYVFFQIPENFDTYEAAAWQALGLWMRDPSDAHYNQLINRLEAIL